MAGNRLAQILEREYKTQGLIGGLGSAMGKRVREKMDIRNALFGGSGFTGIVGRKVFGKGYSATSGSNKIESNESAQLSEQTEKIDSIANTSRIVAKNTLALPSMARDMYLVKQNIIKLVKLNGGNAQTKAGEWFSRQKARESAFGNIGGSKTPTKTNAQQSSSGGGFLGFLGGMIDMIGPGKLLAVVSGIAAVGVALVGFKGALEMISKMITSIYNWVAKTEIGRALGMKETEGSSGGSSGGGSGNGERGWKNPLDVNWSKVGGKAVDVASNVGGVGADIAGIWAGKKIGNIGPKFVPAKVDLMDGRDWHKIENKLVTERLSSKEISNGRMGRVIERLRVFSVEAAKKGWAPRIRTKLTAKLGSWVAMKCATLFASLAAAPFSAGLSLLISLVSWAMLMKDLYDIYDAICGPGGIWDELHEEDKSTTTPTQKTTTEIDSNNATISKLKTQMETTTNSYEKESLQKKISYYEDKNKKLAAQTPPTASTGDSGSGDFNFAEYKRSVGGAESGGDYNTTFNNPNAVINGKPLSQNTIGEVAAWQDKNRASNRHAAGKYQFIDVAGAAKGAGLSMNDLFSAINQEKMMDSYTKANAETLKKNGFQASKENLSLAHMVGAGRASELLKLQQSGQGGLNVAKDVYHWGKDDDKFKTNQHLNKSVDQVIADAGKRVGSPNYSPSGSDTGNMLAQLQQNPFAGFAEMLSSNFGDMLNDYHQKTKDGGNFDSGSLQTYNDEFLKKLLNVQTFQPNKA